MGNSIINRNRSYISITDKLPSKRKRVYEIILLHKSGITAQGISERYSVPINQITGRITELKEMCFIKEGGSELSPATGNRRTKWIAVTDPDEYINLSNLMYAELTHKKNMLVSDKILNLSNHTRDFIDREIRNIDKKIFGLGKNTAI